MPYKDQDKQREYQREWAREKRAAQVKPSSSRTLNPEDYRTAQGLLNTLSEVIAEVRNTEADPLIRARLLGYLISIGLKCVETADLEQRITQLEEGPNQLN